MGDDGGGHRLVRTEWRPAGWSVCLPLLIFPCTIKSRSSLLAPAHPGGPRKRAVKWLWWKRLIGDDALCKFTFYITLHYVTSLPELPVSYLFPTLHKNTLLLLSSPANKLGKQTNCGENSPPAKSGKGNKKRHIQLVQLQALAVSAPCDSCSWRQMPSLLYRWLTFHRHRLLFLRWSTREHPGNTWIHNSPGTWWHWLVGWLVGRSLTSPFSANTAISKTKGQGWRVTQWRKASNILTSTLAAFLFSSYQKKGKGSRDSFKLLR